MLEAENKKEHFQTPSLTAEPIFTSLSSSLPSSSSSNISPVSSDILIPNIKPDPTPAFEKFTHSMVIACFIGILLFMTLLYSIYIIAFDHDSDTIFKIGFTIILVLVLASFSMSYILYCNNIINIDGTYKVGDYSKTICGPNIYILDTGEYKVSEGITGFTSNSITNTALNISKSISSYTIFILVIGYIYVLIKGFLDTHKYCDGIDKELMNCEVSWKKILKIVVFIMYLLYTIYGKEMFSLFTHSNLSILNLNKDATKLASKLYFKELVIAITILIIPISTFSDRGFLNKILGIIEYLFRNLFELIKYINLKHLILIIILIILNRTLNKLVSDSNVQILESIKKDWLGKYILPSDTEISKNPNHALSDHLITVLDNLPLLKHGANTGISYTPLDNLFIKYFEQNIKNAYASSLNPISGSDPLLIRDYGENLFKFIQFNRGKELDSVVNGIQKYINDKQYNLENSNYSNLFQQLLLNSPDDATNNNVDNDKDLIYYIQVISNIRRICHNMKNDSTLKNYVNNTTKNLILITIIILSVSLYIFIHPLIKNNINVIGYIIFLIIIFTVLMAGYGWATGFTY